MRLSLDAVSEIRPPAIDLLGRRLGELDDRELRLLAVGIGEHIPHEVIVNVEYLRSERARLLARCS